MSSRVNWKIDNTAIGSVSADGISRLPTGRAAKDDHRVFGNYIGDGSGHRQLQSRGQRPVGSQKCRYRAAAHCHRNRGHRQLPGGGLPSANTIFPRNIYKILFTFTGGTGNDLYRLEFKSPQLTLSVYTTATSWTRRSSSGLHG